jgi:hypothetical protein
MHAVLTMRIVFLKCKPGKDLSAMFDITYSTKHINSVKMELNLNYAVGPYFI